MSDLDTRAREAASKATTMAEFRKLSERELQCLRFVVNYLIRTGGVSPSYAEISDALNLRSKSHVHRLMHALEEAGKIRIGRNRARSIEVIGDNHVPIYRASDNQLMGFLP